MSKVVYMHNVERRIQHLYNSEATWESKFFLVKPKTGPAGARKYYPSYKKVKVKERIVLREIHLRTTGRHLSM